MGKVVKKVAALCIVLAVISAYFWTEKEEASGSEQEVTHIAMNAARPSCSINGCSLTRSH
ncbi:MAG: hypothetical protein IKO41_00400 [Lachnospiraceae bacterium]|nr:hypothetical protein [Lachnospiraceae bacterium]